MRSRIVIKEFLLCFVALLLSSTAHKTFLSCSVVSIEVQDYCIINTLKLLVVQRVNSISLVDTHLSKHFYCLVEKTGLHLFRHWQQMSSTVEDTQQSESVSLQRGG